MHERGLRFPLCTILGYNLHVKEIMYMSQGPAWRVRPQVIPGMKLGTLIRVLARNDFRVDTHCLGRLAHLVILGVFNSIFSGCETVLNMREIREVQIEHPPLFVLGHWRSGTTHLHNLLACDENFACPTAYQACFPHHFVFSQAGGTVFNLLAPEKRPMDNVAFSSSTPHEDEFALAAVSTVSPYMKVLFPVTGDELYSRLDPLLVPLEAREEWARALVLFLKKLTLSEGRRAVLKSPPNTARISPLLNLFPDAQFVNIVRDPYIVYLSTHKLWKDALGNAHLQVPDPEQVDEMILSWYCQMMDLYERDKGLIPSGALHEMKFEDLEQDPLGVLRDMYQKLDLPGFSEFEPRVIEYLSSIEGYEKNNYSLDEATRAKVYRRWSTTFERHRYPQ